MRDTGEAVLEHLVEGRGRGEVGGDVDLDEVRREVAIEEHVEAEDLEARVAPAEALAVARADVRLRGDERLHADGVDLVRVRVRVSTSCFHILLATSHFPLPTSYVAAASRLLA